jgi:hypothetical protein
MEILLTILAFLYATTGITEMIGYAPTVRDLKKRIASANIHSYFIWTFTTAVTFLYAIFIVSDTLLEIVTGLNFLCCTTIFVLALELKNKVAKEKKLKHKL